MDESRIAKQSKEGILVGRPPNSCIKFWIATSEEAAQVKEEEVKSR